MFKVVPFQDLLISRSETNICIISPTVIAPATVLKQARASCPALLIFSLGKIYLHRHSPLPREWINDPEVIHDPTKASLADRIHMKIPV